MHSSLSDNSAQSRPRTAVTTSISAMGWASMLLLVSSSASALSADVSRISFPAGGIPSSVGLSATPCVASTRPKYRRRSNLRTSTGVLDPSSRSIIHTSDIGWSSTQTCLRVQPETRLRYRDGDDGESHQRRQEHEDAASNGLGGWLKAVLPPTVKEDPIDEKQRRVDDYLEFLDKRYNRLHSDEKVVSKKAGFSALGWLHSPSNDEAIADRQNEDALYVLGVAELASERLLQKHHLATQQVSSESLRARHQAKSRDVIDATVVDKVKDEASAAQSEPASSRASNAVALSEMVGAGASVLRRLQARRNVLMRYQQIKLRAAMMVALKALAKVPRTASALWRLGGGTKTLAVTASAAAAVFLVVRPVVQGMIYEAAYRG